MTFEALKQINLFCPAVRDVLLDHLENCRECQNSLLLLADEMPILTMMLPHEAKKAIDELKKKAKEGN